MLCLHWKFLAVFCPFAWEALVDSHIVQRCWCLTGWWPSSMAVPWWGTGTGSTEALWENMAERAPHMSLSNISALLASHECPWEPLSQDNRCLPPFRLPGEDAYHQFLQSTKQSPLLSSEEAADLQVKQKDDCTTPWRRNATLAAVFIF